jgi:nucleotide-binding universal stress UspA family protein
MAKRILVALEGPDDPIVPLVSALARGGGASVRLMRVLPVPSVVEAAYRRTIATAVDEMARQRDRASSDLALAAAALDGVPVETTVRFGDLAHEVATEADVFDADLVAASSRRRTLAGFLWPRPGDRIGHRVSAPVLLLRDGRPAPDAPTRRTS